MHFDFAGAELFLNYWTGQALLEQVLDHLAYRTVWQHAALFADGITGQDVEHARRGQPSPYYYELGDLSTLLPRIHEFLSILRTHADHWMTIARTSLYRARLAVTQLGVESVTQGVAQQIEAQHGDEDRQAGEIDEPGRGVDIAAGAGEERAPFGGGGLVPKTDVAQRGGGKHSSREVKAGMHDDPGKDVDEDMAAHDAR